MIKGFANILKMVFAKDGAAYRIGGDEFVVVVCNTNEAYIDSKINQITESVSRVNRNSDVKISVAIGYDNISRNQFDNLEKALIRADRKMYAHKAEFKNNNKNGE